MDLMDLGSPFNLSVNTYRLVDTDGEAVRTCAPDGPEGPGTPLAPLAPAGPYGTSFSM